jgi:phosphoglucosamine mutase
MHTEVELVFATPNGININQECGSTHMSALQEIVVSRGFDLGLAFDGDADRCLAVDATGEIINGDKIMAILATRMKNLGLLKQNTVVATVMSNMGFHEAMSNRGITVKETKVGDRYVLQAIQEGGFNFGGEQSGHIIFRDYSTTGDGLLTALMLVSTLQESGKTLHDLAKEIDTYPQVLLNVRLEDKESALSDRQFLSSLDAANDRIKGKGRILVRPSGTEPLLRIMVEAKEATEANEIAESLAAIVSGTRLS